MNAGTHDQLIRRIKLRELRLLLAVADAGSFHGAARLCHMTQPAVTSAIASLEVSLGARLYERSSKGVQPTPAGAHLILRARAIFGELKLALEELSNIDTVTKRVLHIGSVPLPASGILPVALEFIQRENVDLSVSVLEASEQVLHTALKSRRVDFYFSRLSREAKDPALRFDVLYEDTLCIIAKKNHVMAHERGIPFPDLAGERWVLPPAGSFFHDHIERALAQHDYVLPRPAIETLSAPVMHGMIAHGPYVGFSTRSVYRHNPIAHLVTELDVPLPNVSASIGLVSLRDRPVELTGQRLAHIVRVLGKTGKPPRPIRPLD